MTGGAGFIGSNLVRALLERGDEVRVLDNFSTGSRGTSTASSVEVVEGELRSYERVHNAVRGIEVVFHLGALRSVPRSVQDPLTTSAVNVEGTLNVLLAARDEGVRRVVFASSSSVYGSSRALPRRESAPPDPISPYGVAKLAAERYCVSFSRVYEPSRRSCSATSTCSGRGRTRDSEYAAVVPLFIDGGRDGRAGDDLRRRRAVARLHLRRRTSSTPLPRAADAPGASGRIFNVAAGAPASVNDLRRRSAALLGSRSRSGTRRRGRATSATRGRTSPRRATRSAGSRRSALEEGLRLTAEALLGLSRSESFASSRG